MRTRTLTGVHVLFATAELSPLARVGGLAEASGGLVRALRASGVDVDVVVPDYADTPLADESTSELEVASWARPMHVRRGHLDGFGSVTLIGGAGIAKPHPYVDAHGEGWSDNNHRFAAFSAAVARLIDDTHPDLVHLNDWHVGTVPAFLPTPPPLVLTIHTLGYQGTTGAWLLDRLPTHRTAYEWWGSANPLLGAIRLADRVLTVSPTYAREIVRPETGMGLDHELRERGDTLIGIRNGIDTAEWAPSTDSHLAARYGTATLAGKRKCRTALLREVGWTGAAKEPIIGVVSRLVDQKGIDLLTDIAHLLPGLGARLVVLGAGQRRMADRLHELASDHPEWVSFTEGYDIGLGHRIFAGADLFAMPSRFEPCGLAQMQAMAYGTIPVVTDVGGLHDTVIDDDAFPDLGTGFVARSARDVELLDALHRAVRAWRTTRRRAAIIERGMSTDWSWTTPAGQHIELYDDLVGRR